MSVTRNHSDTMTVLCYLFFFLVLRNVSQTHGHKLNIFVTVVEANRAYRAHARAHTHTHTQTGTHASTHTRAHRQTDAHTQSIKTIVSYWQKVLHDLTDTPGLSRFPCYYQSHILFRHIKCLLCTEALLFLCQPRTSPLTLNTIKTKRTN